jgi:hypothetical protein
MKDTGPVNFKSHFDLRPITGSGRDPGEIEAIKEMVVLDLRTLSLIHGDGHSRLVIECSRKPKKNKSEKQETTETKYPHLGFLRGDGRLARDKRTHGTTLCLDTKGARCNIDNDGLVLHKTSRNDGGPDSRTVSNGFIRID